MDIDQPEYTSPGWYPDPRKPGTTRWWDGTEWSDHVQGSEAQAPAVQASEVPAARIPRSRRSRFAWLAVSAVTVGVVIAIVTGHPRANQVPDPAPVTQAQPPAVAPAPSAPAIPLPAGGFDPGKDAASERTAMEGQLQQLAATLATDRGSSAQFPATLSLDPSRSHILAPDGEAIGAVPDGEEFSYNASADRSGYVMTLDELTDGVGVRFDSATAMLTGY